MSFLSDIGDFLFGWLMPTPPKQTPPGAELTKASTDAFIPKIYGKVKKQPGYIIFKRSNDFDNDDLKNDLLHIIVVWGHNVSSIDEVYFDDIPASSDNELFFYEGARIAYSINFINGMAGYSDEILNNAGWELTDQLAGCACSYIRLEYMGAENTLNNEPSISADLTGTTWSNPMLALQSYLTNPIYGKGESSSRINLTRLSVEQGICDADVETFPGSGVNRKQFTFNAAVDGNNSVLDNVNLILKSCRAWLPVLDGKLTPIIEKDDPPVSLEITEDEIIELGKISDSNKNQRYNAVIVEYYDDSANATKQEAIYPEPGSAESIAWLAQDNHIVLEKRQELHTCRNYYEALAHAKSIAEISRQQLRVPITLPIWATLFEVGDIVNVSHSYPGWVSKPFRIERTTEGFEEVELLLREHQPASYVAPGEQAPPVIPDTGLPGGGGTVTPGQTDYTQILTRQLQSLVDSGVGGELKLARGDFYITETLLNGQNLSNITIRGEGMPAYRTEWLNISSVENVAGNAVLTLSGAAANTYLTHRVMSGDVVKIDGSSDPKLEGIKEVASIDPANLKITITSSATNDLPTSVGGLLRLSVLVGGSIIRFQNHKTGEISTGKRFFDCVDTRNFNLYDIGFVGPGVNSVFGGGMRFRRVTEPDGRSRAITGYNWKNVLLTHAAMDAVRFDQLIHSYLGHLNINRCVGDALLFQAGPEGGTTTSVHIDTPYLQNVRRGIAFYTAAYCTITNPVIEGTSVGYYVNRGIGLTFNSMASETIKFDNAGQGGGVTGQFINSYGITINSPTVYYNSEESAWSKAALTFVDPVKRVESPTAVINGGHIQWSLGEKIPVIGTFQTVREGRVYLDVSSDTGYIGPDGATGSSWIGNSFWDDSIQVYIKDCTTIPEFDNRYKATNLTKTPWVDLNFNRARPPASYDSSGSNFAWPPQLDKSNPIVASFIAAGNSIYLRRINTGKSFVGGFFDEETYDAQAIEAGNNSRIVGYDFPADTQGIIGDSWICDYSLGGISPEERTALESDPFQIFIKGDFTFPAPLDLTNALGAAIDAGTNQITLRWHDQYINLRTGNERLVQDITAPLFAQLGESVWEIYYDETELSSGQQADLIADPWQILSRTEPTFAAFDSFYRNLSEDSRAGRYLCVNSTEGAAKWYRTEETFELDFYARKLRNIDKAPEPAGCFAFRMGRNYGVDVATDNVQRVMATETSAEGRLSMKLDISHLHPVRYITSSNFNAFGTSAIDPYAGGSSNEYTVKAVTVETVTYGGSTDDYICVELVIGSSGNYQFHAYSNPAVTFAHEPDAILPALNGYFEFEGTGDPIEIRFDDFGQSTVITADLKRIDITPTNDGNLFLYMKADRYLNVGDKFNVQQCMLNQFDGYHEVRSIAPAVFEGIACLNVETETNGLETNIRESVDYAVYVADKWSIPVSNNITMDGFDTLFTYDKANSISVQGSRSGTAKALDSSTSTTINLAAANNYYYYAYVKSGLERIAYESNTYTSVTFIHDPMIGSKDFTWVATRKKSPGLEAIYDRN